MNEGGWCYEGKTISADNLGGRNFSYLAFCLPELDLSVVTRY